MKQIFCIAKHQLRLLFYSPLAWAALIGIYIAGILTYFDKEQIYIEVFLKGGAGLSGLYFLTIQLVSNLVGRSPSILTFLYILLPMVTMGVFSNEFRNGTIKILFSSPVKTRHIVLGKFLGLLIFNFCIVGVVHMVFLCIASNVAFPDWGVLVSATIGICLLCMLLASIGMYISSLTSYQVVAGMVTVISFHWLIEYIIRFVEFLGHGMGFFGMGTTVAFSYILEYMPINRKVMGILHGSIGSREVIYFFNITGLFVLLTLIRVKFLRQKTSRAKKLLYQALAFGIVFAVGFVSNQADYKYFADLTRKKQHSLDTITQEMVSSMNKGPLQITYFVNLFDRTDVPPLYPSGRVSGYQLWEKYQTHKTDIHIKFEYYYNIKGGETDMLKRYPGLTERQVAEKLAQVKEMPLKWFKSPDEMNAQIDLSFEQYRNVAQLEYQGRKTFLRLFPRPPNQSSDPYFPEEKEIVAALNRLTGVQPVVNFSTGHAEFDPYGYGSRGIKMMLNETINKHAMINYGLDADTITLDRRMIPDSSKALAICAPLFPLSNDFLDRFDECLRNGKNLFIAADPDKRDVVQPLFDRLGITVRKGILGCQAKKASGEEVTGYLTSAAKGFSKSLAQRMNRILFYSNDSMRVKFLNAVALEIDNSMGFKAEPFIVLDTRDCFNRPEAISIKEMEGILRKRPTDEIQPFAMAYKLTRMVNGREQRIVVMGSLSTPGAGGFRELAPHIFGWLAADKYPVDILYPEAKDIKFDFKIGSLKTRKLVWIYFITGTFVLAASIVLIRRSRK